MKTTITLIVFCFFWISLIAQTPQAFKYQAVARNTTGEVLANQLVSFRISILKGSVTGAIVYTETHKKTTNAFGLVDLEIGRGTPVTGLFSNITWGNDAYFINMELDPSGGTAYQFLGASQLLSIPYALFAKDVLNKDDADADPTNELQKISISGTVLTLDKNGGSVTLPSSGTGGDNWGTQAVVTDATLAGTGTPSSPLKIAQQSAASGQVLKWNGSTWTPGDDATGTGFTLPYVGTANDAIASLKITNSNTTSGSAGIFGINSSTTGTSYGILGESFSTHGSGVYGTSPYIGVLGHPTTSSGVNFGIVGETNSVAGYAVGGYAYSQSGENIGVFGYSNSSSGVGVKGFVNSSSGITYGVYGEVASPSGFAGYFNGGKFYISGNTGIGIENPGAKLDVAGQVKITGGTPGVGKVLTSDATGLASWQTPSGGLTLPYFGYISSGEPAFAVTNGGTGHGIKGSANSSTGTTFGVYGTSASSLGSGVFGYNSSSTGSSYGIYGQSMSATGKGAFGEAAAGSGQNYGVYGITASTEGTAVFGQSTAATGATHGVWGAVHSNTGYSGYFTGGKFYVDGNVGIGTDNPGAKLEVTGRVKITAGNPGIGKVLTSDANGLATWETPGLILPFDGTVASDFPVFKVSNTGIGNGLLAISNSPTGSRFGITGASYSSSGAGVIGTSYSTIGTTYGITGKVHSSTGYSGYFEGGRFYAEGNVGIGVLEPAYKLDVSGNRIRLINDTEWIALRTDGNTGFLDLSYSGGKLVIQGSATDENIILNPAMNKVGIRTWTPQYELDVNGNIRATGSVYYGGTAGSANGLLYGKPDYVFGENYEKLNTEQVEEYLKNESHLPWVTSSEQERKENGDVTNMTRMSFETLEAVENLQLQVIQQDKVIRELKSRLEKLESLVGGQAKK